jgi:ABC-type multidrug transport system ATPase subunit
LVYSVDIGKKERERLHVPEGEKRKDILKGVSGYAKNGQTLFIMGASGAGKTTLLNVLCDRVMRSNKTKLTGDVMINDEIQVK